MAETAGAAGEQGRDLLRHAFRQNKAAGALGTQQPLMAGEGQGVDVHGLHVDGPHACGLGAVHEEFQPVGPAEVPRLLNGQQRAADVAGVGHHHCPGLRRQTGFHGLRPQRPRPVAGDAGERAACLRQLRQGPHDGVVLHGGHQHMVPRPQKALQQHVEALRHVFGEDHIAAVRPVEQLAQQLPGLVHDLLHLIGAVVAAPVDVDTRLRHIAVHRLRHPGRLGKGGAGVVQIDLFHKVPLLGLL